MPVSEESKTYPMTFWDFIFVLLRACTLFYRVLKRVGGQWISSAQRQQVDGDKFVCLDLILKKNSCLIYSFGVASDWTFEDQMDNIGWSFTN